MPDPILFLVRHAETEWNVEPKRYQGRTDVSISERGHETARGKLGEIDWGRFDSVVSSPAVRCQETLQIAKEIGFSPRGEFVDERLWEIDNGWFSGLTADEICKIDRGNFEAFSKGNPDIRAGGGESIRMMAERVMTSLKFWMSETEAETPVFFVHGGPIRCVLGSREGFGLEQFHSFQVPNLSLWQVPTSEISGWGGEKDEW